MGHPGLLGQLPECIESTLQNRHLHQSSTEADGNLRLLVDFDFLHDVLGDISRSPTQFNDIHVRGYRVQQILQLAQTDSFVHDMSDTDVPWLAATGRERKKFQHDCLLKIL